MAGIKNLLEHPTGQIVISILLGLGLATLFRKVCNGNSCVVIQGPKLSDVTQYVYKVDKSCYKYTPSITDCKYNSIKEE